MNPFQRVLTLHPIDGPGASLTFRLRRLGDATRSWLETAVDELARSTAGFAATARAAVLRPPRSAKRTAVRWAKLRLDAVVKWVIPPTVFLVHENGQAHVTVVHRGRFIAWTASPDDALSPEHDKTPSVLAGRVRALLKINRISRFKAVTSVPLGSSLLREVPLPLLRKRYVGQVVAAEVADTVPFERDDVDVVWHVVEGELGTVAAAIAVPREVVDRQVRRVRALGAHPSAVYSEAEALTLASGLDEGIVVRLSARHASMALVRGRRPRTLYRAALDQRAASAEQRLQPVVDAMDQLASYAADGEREPLELLRVPVRLAGAESDVEALREILAGNVRYRARLFPAPAGLPRDFPRTRFATTLGLASVWGASTTSGLLRRKRLAFDLLQKRHLPKRLPLASGAATAVLLTLAGLAFSATSSIGTVEATVDRMSDRVATMERQYRLAWGRANVVIDNAGNARAFTQQLASLLTELRSETDVLLDRVEAIASGAKPEGVRVPKLAPEGASFVIAGDAPSFDQVFAYAANLRATGLFEDVAVVRLDSLESPAGALSGLDNGVVPVIFQIQVTLPADGSEEANAGAVR